MEKNKQTYDLREIRKIFSDIQELGNRTTATAFLGAQEMGFSREDMMNTIKRLSNKVSTLSLV